MGKCVEVRNLGKRFYREDGEYTEICKNFNLNIENGKIYSMIGNSGCGKTTLINMIGGFESYEEGEILYSTGTKENVGIIFQENVLFPWKTIMDNMLFACKNLYENPEQVIKKKLEDIGLMQITECYPRELSGGMQQRVALLRVLLTKPRIVILDEAFGALDYKTRNQMQDFFLKIQQEEKFTAIVVTHDLYEACKLGDKIWILKDRPLICKEINVRKEKNTQTIIEELTNYL